jgi:hypothetical protein
MATSYKRRVARMAASYNIQILSERPPSTARIWPVM